MTTNAFLLRELNGVPKQICFRGSSLFNPSAPNDLRDATGGFVTLVDMTPSSIASGAYWQSAKADLGAILAPAYKVRAAIPFQATPTDQASVEFAWAPSHSATAANGNPGGISGADSAYTGYSSNAASGFLQIDYIGAFRTTVQVSASDNSLVQIAEIGILMPSERYGTLVMFQNSGAALRSGNVNFHVIFEPLVTEMEAAA